MDSGEFSTFGPVLGIAQTLQPLTESRGGYEVIKKMLDHRPTDNAVKRLQPSTSNITIEIHGNSEQTLS